MSPERSNIQQYFSGMMIDLQLIDRALDEISSGYSPLQGEAREQFRIHSRICRYEPQEIFVREGEYSDTLYYILDGSARAYYLKDGRDITDWFAFNGGFLTAINAYFFGIPSPHYLSAIEPCTTLEISQEKINELRATYHQVETLTVQAISRTMLELQMRVVSLQFETAQQKYENLLAVRPDIEQRVPLTHIASHLGITLETLSRIRSSHRI